MNTQYYPMKNIKKTAIIFLKSQFNLLMQSIVDTSAHRLTFFKQSNSHNLSKHHCNSSIFWSQDHRVLTFFQLKLKLELRLILETSFKFHDAQS